MSFKSLVAYLKGCMHISRKTLESGALFFVTLKYILHPGKDLGVAPT